MNTEDSTLQYVNGLNEQLAKNIIEYRRKYHSFYNRLQLKRVPGITDQVFRQCAGFLMINRDTILNFNQLDAQLLNIYDSTIIHPEMYDDADKILNALEIPKENLGKQETIMNCRKCLLQHGIGKYINYFQKEFNINPISTKIIIDALATPLSFDYRTNIVS